MILSLAKIVKTFGDLHLPKLSTSFATQKSNVDGALVWSAATVKIAR